MAKPSLLLWVLGCLLFCAACDGQVATVLASDDSGTSAPGQDAGGADGASSGPIEAGASDCAPRGGVCLPSGASAPPNRRSANASEGRCSPGEVCWVLASAGDAACTTDPDCNDDPSVSALHGGCFMGVCICKNGFFVQPNGKCGPTKPASCPSSGGTCRQMPAQCNAGELETHFDTSQESCGDLIAAVCCVPTASCKAPIDLVCCGASTTEYEPSCVNGWKTCGASGPTPKVRTGTCF